MIKRIDTLKGLQLSGMARPRLWEILWGYRLAGHESDIDTKLIHATVREWEKINNQKWR